MVVAAVALYSIRRNYLRSWARPVLKVGLEGEGREGGGKGRMGGR